MTPQTQPTPEQVKAQLDQQQKAAAQSKKIQNLLEQQMLPALLKQAPKLLEAGKLSEMIANVVMNSFNQRASEVKISDLGLIDKLDAAVAMDKDEKHQVVYSQQRGMLEACQDFTVAEFQQVMQWFGQTANAFAEKSASQVDLEDCFISLKEQTDEKPSKEAEGAIASPYVAEGTDTQSGDATAG